LTTKCRYMEAAYPTLDAEDTCGYAEHRHDAQTFALARALAIAGQGTPEPLDEQIAWFLEDAAAIVDDFDPPPQTWDATEPQLSDEPGLEFAMVINDVPYVVQTGGHKEPAHPVRRSTWEAWTREADAAAEPECVLGTHDWMLRPESDTYECRGCGDER
jgi:hypothetical protein